MKGSVPARIVASGLRLLVVDRTQQFSPWVDTNHNAWVSVRLLFNGHPDTDTRLFMMRYADVLLFDCDGTTQWTVFRSPGHPLVERTYYWERMILKLQQLL